MIDTNRVVRMIESANAVPDADLLPEGALSSSDLLARIDERNTPMTNTTIRRRPDVPPTGSHGARHRYRGPLIGLATAAAIALVFVITNLGTDDGASPVANVPVQNPTTPRAARALPADTPLMDVVGAFQARFDTGDVDGYEAIFDPNALYVSGSDAELSWFGATTGLQHERDCEPVTNTQVSCVERLVSGLQPGSITDEFVSVWQGANGYVTSITYPDGFPTEFVDPADGLGVPEYRAWLERTNPDAFADLFVDGLTMKLDTEEARQGHKDFVPFYLSSTGPRAAGALPIDTPLIDVVATFTERFDAGDIAGYEAIFHPMAGYRSGQDAETSWFGEVTGMQHERNCEPVSATQVRCVERAISGLEPGTVSDEFTSLWNGSDGYIWSIEFPDAQPVEFTDPNAGPGVATYRDWVEANEPEALAHLFVDGTTLKLDTEEARAAHRELVARFLADTAAG